MFELTWSETALEQLADAYVAAGTEDRERMATAIEALNVRLRADPLAVGESRIGTFRVVFVLSSQSCSTFRNRTKPFASYGSVLLVVESLPELTSPYHPELWAANDHLHGGAHAPFVVVERLNHFVDQRRVG